MFSPLRAQDKRNNTKLCIRRASVKEASDGLIQPRATVEGHHEQAVKELAEAGETLASAHSNFMRTAAGHEQPVKAREDELKITAEGAHIMK